MASRLRIYHNPRCSKSRAALAILEQRGEQAEVIEYLNKPPTKKELRVLLGKLGMRPAEIVRRGESLFKSRYLDRQMSDEQWLDALAADPILIERPIVVVGERAVVARPPERVLELL